MENKNNEKGINPLPFYQSVMVERLQMHTRYK